jgi:hypothetical protein
MANSQLDGVDEVTLVLDAGGVRKIATILGWDHPLGGRAHCLARLVLRPAWGPPVAVLSEVADNPDRIGLTSDMGGAADAFLARMRAYARLDPDRLMWIAHHGPFSSADDDGGTETFTQVDLINRQGVLHGDLRGHHLLTPGQVLAGITPLGLQPVSRVLAELRGIHI